MHSSKMNMSTAALKEKREPIKQVMERINYSNHNWVICVNLNMVNFLPWSAVWLHKVAMPFVLVGQSSRDQHWQRKDWPLQTQMKAGKQKKDVASAPLVP